MKLFRSRGELFFEDLMKSNYSKLLLIAESKAANKDVAKDLVQETFLTAWSGIDAIMASPNPAGWLVKTLRNHILHHYRDHYRDKANLDFDREPHGEHGEFQTILNEIALASALAPDEVKILNLKAQGYKHREIAKMLNYPLGTIDSKVSRLKAKIIKLFSDE